MAHTNTPHTADPDPTNPDAPNPDPSRRYQCRHIHAIGRRCGSPSLRGENFCFYHVAARRPPKHLGLPPAEAVFTLLPIEDHTSLQLCLADVLARVAANSLDTKRARLLLHGLNLASLNLARATAAGAPSRLRLGGMDGHPNPNQITAVIEDLELDPDLGPLAPVAQVGAGEAAAEAAETDLRQRFIDYCNRPKEPCKQCAEYERIEANRAEGRRLQAEIDRRRAAGLPRHDPPINWGTPYPADPTWAAAEARLPGSPTYQPTPPQEAVILTLNEVKGKDPDTAHPTSTARTLQTTDAAAPSKLRLGGNDATDAGGVSPTDAGAPSKLRMSGVSSPQPNDPPSPTPPHAEDPSTPGLPNPSPETLAAFAAHLPTLKACAELTSERGAPCLDPETWESHHHRRHPDRARRASGEPALSEAQPSRTGTPASVFALVVPGHRRKS